MLGMLQKEWLSTKISLEILDFLKGIQIHDVVGATQEGLHIIKMKK
jgi:hypothetical protein